MTTNDSLALATAALERWPWIVAVEDDHHLPRWLLLAIGLRESELDPAFAHGKTGDSGHGHGPWQYDDRTPGREAAIRRIDGGDVQFAASIAAQMLADNFARHHDWTKALNVYNSGQTDTQFTALHNYGPDVLEDLAVLQQGLPPVDQSSVDPKQPPPFMEDAMAIIATDPNTGHFWVLTGPDGGIDARNPDGSPAGPDWYFGNLVDHPQFNAGHGKANGDAIGISFWPQGAEGTGYVIFTDARAADGFIHTYRFDRGTRPA